MRGRSLRIKELKLGKQGFLKIGTFMRDNGMDKIEVGGESRCGRMGLSMKVTGRITLLMGMVG